MSDNRSIAEVFFKEVFKHEKVNIENFELRTTKMLPAILKNSFHTASQLKDKS